MYVLYIPQYQWNGLISIPACIKVILQYKIIINFIKLGIWEDKLPEMRSHNIKYISLITQMHSNLLSMILPDHNTHLSTSYQLCCAKFSGDWLWDQCKLKCRWKLKCYRNCVDKMSPWSLPIESPLWHRFCGHFKKYLQAHISRVFYVLILNDLHNAWLRSLCSKIFHPCIERGYFNVMLKLLNLW